MIAYRLLPLLLVAFTHQVAIFASRPLIPLLADDLGASLFSVGLIGGTYNGIQIAAALTAGRLTDRIGPRHAALWGSLALLLGLLGLAAATDWGHLLALQVLIGVGHLLVQLGYQSVGADPRTGVSREQTIGLLFFAASVGQAIGPAAGGWIADGAGLRFGMVGAALVAALSLGTTLLLPPRAAAASKSGKEGASGLALLRNPRVAGPVSISVMALLAQEFITSYLPLYARELGLATGAIGLVLSMRAAGAMVVRPFTAQILKLLGQRRATAATLLVGGACTALYGLSANLPLLVLASLLLGLSLGAAQPLTVILVTEAAPEEQVGNALALRLLGNRVGSIAGSILFGGLAAWFGLAPVFWITGALLAAGSRLARAPAASAKAA